jgi:methylenetetrahydrofolate reductase (NADPH)
MHIRDILQTDKPTVSFEFFPPKTAESQEQLYTTIRDLEKIHPNFVSVTYGAGGSTRNSPMILCCVSKPRPHWIRFRI